MDSDDVEMFRPRPAPTPRASATALMFTDSNHPVMVPAGIPKQEFRRQFIPNPGRWLQRMVILHSFPPLSILLLLSMAFNQVTSDKII